MPYKPKRATAPAPIPQSSITAPSKQNVIVSEPTFDANERIAGFSMIAIKRTLQRIGLMPDRDDIQTVASALSCPRNQAERVLEELERRELVSRTPKRKQWDTTFKGRRLAFHWDPPRRFTPAIERPYERNVMGEGFAEVPCGILRFTPDGEDMFEEGELDATMHVEYEGDRLVEINVPQPDEYQGERADSSNIALSVYLTAKDAKVFAEGLQKAIARAEREVERRRTKQSQRTSTGSPRTVPRKSR